MPRRSSSVRRTTTRRSRSRIGTSASPASVVTAFAAATTRSLRSRSTRPSRAITCVRSVRPSRASRVVLTTASALGLIELSKRTGVRGGVAVNALDSTLAIRDPNARLRPQTERLKAALLAEALTGSSAYATIAASAASTLMRYLDTEVPGLWFDELLPDGKFRVTPAPASTLYHLIGAVEALCRERCSPGIAARVGPAGWTSTTTVRDPGDRPI